MKFTSISLLYVIVGASSFAKESEVYGRRSSLQFKNSYTQYQGSKGRPWSDELFPRIRGGPFQPPQIREELGPALFPQPDPFPPGGPSVLAPQVKGPQNFQVSSSLNFGNGQGNDFGSFGGGNFQGSSGLFDGGSFTGGFIQDSNPLGGGTGSFNGDISGSFPAGTLPGSLQGSFVNNGRPFQQDEFFNNIGILNSFGSSNAGSGVPNQQFNTAQNQGFDGLPGKYESTLAKNPLFLVLKLLITDPGLWVTSPVLYHGLAHTGIVKPFPKGFGVYGFRFPNNIPDSQSNGNSNILQDKP